MKNRPKSLILFIALMSASLAAFAFGGHSTDRHAGFAFMMTHYLDLSDEQLAEIKPLTENMKVRMHEKGRKLFKEMMTLNPDDVDFLEQVESFATEKSFWIKEEMIRIGNVRAEIYAILTPEQRVKAQTFKEKMMKRYEKKTL